MAAEGQPQGAMVGDNETAQAIYDSLTRGEMGVFKTAPTGVAPVGGAPFPQPGEFAAVPEIKSPPTSVLKGLVGLKEEILALRSDVRELIELLRSL